MTKEKIRELLNLIKEFKCEVTISFIPEETIYDVQKVYSLYYSGWRKIVIGEYYHFGADLFEITPENTEDVVNRIHEKLSSCVGDYITKALENLELEDVHLKYFDREKELFKKFKAEVLRLKKEATSKKDNKN